MAPTRWFMAGEFHEGDTVIVDRPGGEEGYAFALRAKVAAAARWKRGHGSRGDDCTSSCDVDKTTKEDRKYAGCEAIWRTCDQTDGMAVGQGRSQANRERRGQRIHAEARRAAHAPYRTRSKAACPL